jgi:predicted O-methyltransferase YrrM
MLAKGTGSHLYSFELNPDHINRAHGLINNAGLGEQVSFIQGDSVTSIAHFKHKIGFAYLDSFDHEEHNPLPSQQHQLKELHEVLKLIVYPAGILMDDNVPSTGGKPKLSAPRLRELGWDEAASGYQLFYTKKTMSIGHEP